MFVVLFLRTIYCIKRLIVSFRDKIPRKPNGKKILIYVPTYLINDCELFDCKYFESLSEKCEKNIRIG